MNRQIFIILIILTLIVGYLLNFYEVEGGSFLFAFGMGTLITILRRYYLGMKPYWGGRLRDIPKYFHKDPVKE